MTKTPAAKNVAKTMTPLELQIVAGGFGAGQSSDGHP